MRCRNCGRSLENSSGFCPGCGQPAGSGSFCTNCGADNKPEAKFCRNCGAVLHRAPAPPPPQYIPPPPSSVPPPEHAQPPPQPHVPPPAQPAAAQPVAQAATGGSSADASVTSPPGRPAAGPPKSRVVAAALALVLGQLGLHRFYLGKILTAALQLLLTAAAYVIFLFVLSGVGYALLTAAATWIVIDFMMIVSGKTKDARGVPVK